MTRRGSVTGVYRLHDFGPRIRVYPDDIPVRNESLRGSRTDVTSHSEGGVLGEGRERGGHSVDVIQMRTRERGNRKGL